jgi:hypothetical protein
VTFENGNQALLVDAISNSDPHRLLADLNIRAQCPVVVLAGGAKTLIDDQRRITSRILGPAVVEAVDRTGAAVVDGATESGVMAIVGAHMAHRHANSPLLGVAPSGLVSYPGARVDAGQEGAALEPNHSHFVLVDGAHWGGETQVLIRLAQALAGQEPVVMVVAGGGEVTESEVLSAVRRGWPVFVTEGTGGVADAIAEAWRTSRELAARSNGPLRRRRSQDAAASQSLDIDDSVLEIVRDGDIRLYSGVDHIELARQLSWELQNAKSLKRAWERFATYDGLAVSERRRYERLQRWILVLALMATFLAVLKASIDVEGSFGWLNSVLHWSVVAAPIVVSVLIAMTTRIGAGKRWILLRAAAETIKREIYRFRTGTGVYQRKRSGAQDVSRAEILSAQLNGIESKLIQSEASSAELTPYSGPLPPPMYGPSTSDDGLSELDPDRYIELRIGDQLNFFHTKVRVLARQLRRLQFVSVAAGGAGAILAAAGFDVWIALTTAVGSAALARLAHMQVDSTLVSYNQSAIKLDSLRRGWESLEPAKRSRDAFERLVADAEAVLATELGGWVQQMNEALEELQAEQMENERLIRIDESESDADSIQLKPATTPRSSQSAS